MPGDYAVLAPLYETLRLSAFAETITPSLIAFAQQNDWLGRYLLDLGCGTGAATRLLAARGYNITAIDSSGDMLTEASRRLDTRNISVTWEQADIRALKQRERDHFDLAFAFDVLNEISSLRDVEAVFTGVHELLARDKWFAFDLHTVEGLALQSQRAIELLSESEEAYVSVARHMDYDRQTLTQRFAVFRRIPQTQGYGRANALRVLRGYPVQAITSLLGRVGFEIITVMNTRFERVDPARVDEPRVLIIAQKIAGG